MADWRRQFSGGEDGISRDGSTGAAVWTVTGVSTGRAALNDPDIPVRYNDPHPDDLGSLLRCDNLRVSTISPGFYRLNATFSIPKNGGTHTDQVTNPLSDPPTFRIEPVKESQPTEADYNGEPIRFSSLRGLDPQLYHTFTSYELTVTRNEPHYSLTTAMQYIDRVNSGAWLGAAKGEVKCLGIFPSGATRSDASFLPIEYKFWFKPISVFGNDPHQPRFLDQDTMAWALVSLSGGTLDRRLVRLVDKNGDAVDGPVLLDGFGRPLDKSITYMFAGRPRENPQFGSPELLHNATKETTSVGAVFLRYKLTPEANFSTLGITI